MTKITCRNEECGGGIRQHQYHTGSRECGVDLNFAWRGIRCACTTKTHTVNEFVPCRDATEEMQICQECGEDRRDHLGYEEDPQVCGKRVKVRGWFEDCAREAGHEFACGPWGALP